MPLQVTREPSGVRRLTLQTRGAGSSTSSAMGGSTTAAAGSTSYGGGGGTAAAALLLPRTQWRVTTLYSLVPHFREFQVGPIWCLVSCYSSRTG